MARSSRKIKIMAGSVLVLAATASAADTPMYACTYLKDLSGRGLSTPEAINEKNVVAGVAALEDWRGRRAIVWKTQKPLQLASGADVDSGAFGINDKGVTVGYIQDESRLNQPVMWTANTPTRLPVLTESAPGGTAFKINAKGHVVGWSYNDEYTNRAVLWRNGKITHLGGLDPALESYAYGMNDVGTIVGASKFQVGLVNMQAVRWDGMPKQITALNSLTERGDASARAVNNAGVIVGYSNYQYSAYWEHHAVAWTGTEPIDLGTLPGGITSSAQDINSANVIVGSSAIESGDWHATAWYGLDAAPRDLNDMVAGPGCVDSKGQVYTLYAARAINDLGVIAAWASYTRPDGTTNMGAFRLTPR